MDFYVSQLSELKIATIGLGCIGLPLIMGFGRNINNKVGTGAGESIGSELCRQIVKHQPKF